MSALIKVAFLFKRERENINQALADVSAASRGIGNLSGDLSQTSKDIRMGVGHLSDRVTNLDENIGLMVSRVRDSQQQASQALHGTIVGAGALAALRGARHDDDFLRRVSRGYLGGAAIGGVSGYLKHRSGSGDDLLTDILRGSNVGGITGAVAGGAYHNIR